MTGRWKITTTQREVYVRSQSRDHALWRVAADKREGERILKVEPDPAPRPS